MEKRVLEVYISTVSRPATGAQVRDLDGCFASGTTLDELMAALSEAIALYLGDEKPEPILSRLVGLRVQIEPRPTSSAACGCLTSDGVNARSDPL